MKIAITKGRVIDPKNQFDDHATLFIADGKIAGLGQTPAGFTPDQSIDASGHIVSPGLVDLAARISGIATELVAAVAGGVTTLVCPPDISPTLDEAELVERLVRRAGDLELARVLPLGALTVGLAGERLTEMLALARAGCVAFSHAKQAIADTQALLRILEYARTFDLAVWLHPQDYYLSRGGVAHEGEVANRLGLTGIPVSAETIAIGTLLTLAGDTGTRLHLTRISSAAGMRMIADAQASGLPVSCDVAVHHLHLSEHDIGYFDAMARFAPPLRSGSDRDGLRLGVKQSVAAICSDHTPVDEDDKLLPFGEAKPGATGLELLLPLTLKWAEEDQLPLPLALARITSDPAAILGIDAGHLGIGSAADLCIFNAEADWRVTPEALKSWGKNTPYLGYTLNGRVRDTFVSGRRVHG